MFIFATACEDEHFSDVPEVHFRLPFYLDDNYFKFFDFGTSITVDRGGYAGLIFYYYSENEIRAFDRCCPIHVEEKEHLLIDGALAICPTDSAYFSLLEQPPIQMNSKTPAIMRTYKCSKKGVNLLVYN